MAPELTVMVGDGFTVTIAVRECSDRHPLLSLPVNV
jgi:hypothetical protein